jgi:16S rRNA (adenine1518-N6/adenine1519-N6)-dimethyltransferase
VSEREGEGAALLGPADIRRLAAELGIRPTKKLGQNFVHDPNTVRRIVKEANLTPDDVVIEVGPGLGSLTLGLLDAAAQVHAVELDPVLAAKLSETVAGRAPRQQEKLHVRHDDAVTIGADAFSTKPTALVANLPYNVSVPVVLHLLAELPSVTKVLVMVQAEVADRMAAGPGSKVYGVPSVKIAWYAKAAKAGTVPRAVFWPVPNVDSALVRLERRDEPDGDRGTVFRLVDAAFAQRRKTLRAALAGTLGGAERAAELLTKAGVDPGARGEQLSVTDFAALAAVWQMSGHR